MKPSEGFFKDLMSGRFGAVIRRRINLEKEVKRHRKAYWARIANKSLKSLPSNPLTDAELKKVKKFWRDRYGYEYNPVFHSFYKAATGKFDERYIPEAIYFTEIDPYFNDWTIAKPHDNKNNYRILFPTLRQPETIAFRTNGYWLDGNGKIVNENVVDTIIEQKQKCFVKVSFGSSGGKGVYFIDGGLDSKEEISKILNKIDNDLVIQKELTQSPATALLHPDSLNTIRVMTFMRKDGTLKICSVIIRMGGNGSKVDNASSGGLTVGINMDGQLNSEGYTLAGERHTEHPTTHVKFKDVKIPNFDKVLEMARQGAYMIPQFRLVSWDIALTTDNQPVLVEANLYAGGLKSQQLNNGPIFGDETEEILDEIKNNPKKIDYFF